MTFSFGLQVIQKRRRIRRSQAPEIPVDVVTEILTRLPPKSLMRFKCVSKLWSSLICSSYLSNRFIMVPSPRIYICLSDFRDYCKSVILSASPATSTPSSSFVVDLDLMTIPDMGGYISHYHCGFMCYESCRMPRIYNPTTRQLVTFPTIESNILAPGTYIDYYLGHDAINDQYKVLCSVVRTRGLDISLPDYWVFDLKPGGSWKKVALPPPVDFRPHIPVRRGLSINGVIYYLAWIDSYNYVVVSFDIRSEEFKMILVLRKDEDVHRGTKDMCLIEYGGKVTVFDSTTLKDTGAVDLWVLEDTKNKKWSGKTLFLQPSQLHLVNDIRLEAIGTTQSGKVLMKPYYFGSPFHILCYDLQSNDMRKIEIKGIPDQLFVKPYCVIKLNVMFMDQSESIMYLKT